MAWTTPKTWVAGALTAAELNEQVRDNTDWLKDAFTAIGQTSDSTFGQLRTAAYGAILIRTSNQTISDSTDTAVTFATGSMTEELDSDGLHSGASNTARITIPAGGDGIYLIGANARWAQNGTGIRTLWIELNGSASTGTRIAESRSAPGASVNVIHSLSSVYQLASGDYVTLNCRQTSGGNLALETAAYSVRFWALRLFSV